jgi:hypothetical protein
MSWLAHALRQSVTIWVSGALDPYGNPIYSIKHSKCRWEDLQIKSIDASGEEVLSKSIVYLSVDVKAGDYLALGMSASITPDDSAKEVISFSKIPSLNGKVFERRAALR